MEGDQRPDGPEVEPARSEVQRDIRDVRPDRAEQERVDDRRAGDRARNGAARAGARSGAPGRGAFGQLTIVFCVVEPFATLYVVVVLLLKIGPYMFVWPE